MLHLLFKRFIIVCATVLFASSALAAPGEWMPEAKQIKSLVVDNVQSGWVLVIIEGGVPEANIPQNCRGPYNVIDLSSQQGRAQYAMAMVAYTSGRPIKLALQCIEGRPLITHISLGQM